MTAVPTIDDRTAAAIREAIGLATAGQIASACEIGERALEGGGDSTALNAMLGMLRCRTKEFEAAIRHLHSAHEARPDDLQITANLITALVETGQLEQAFALATPRTGKVRPHSDHGTLPGIYCSVAWQFVRRLQRLTKRSWPRRRRDWQSWNNLGNARLLSEDFDGAVAAFRQSLSLNADLIETWLNLARALVKSRKFDEAETQFRLAANRFPTNAQPLKELYDLMRLRERPDEQLHEVLEQALKRAPNDKDLLRSVWAETNADAPVRSSRTGLPVSPRG